MHTSPAFYYYPHRLEEAVKAAVEVHRRICNPALTDEESWIDNFLEHLAETPASEFRDIAASLRLSELRVLASILGRLRGKPVFPKLVEVLSIRPERAVCAELWGLLGRYCDEPEVPRLLGGLQEDPQWEALAPSELPALPKPLGSAAKIAEHLAQQYESATGGWTETVEGWRGLSPSTQPDRWEDLPLGRRCLHSLLMSPRSRLFDVEHPRDFKRWIETVLRRRADVTAFARAYLELLHEEKWNDDVVDIVVKRLGDPRIRRQNWEGISEPVIQAIIRRINLKKLDEFFLQAAGDRDRFEFWKQFVDYMGPRSEGRISEGQGFFEFPGFGVIEFMAVGNAAYFYPPHVYRRFLQKRPVPNYELKDQYAALYRMLHTRNWFSRNTPVVWDMIREAQRQLGGT